MAVLMVATMAPPVAAGADTRPNVVIIMVDDLGPHDGRMLTSSIMPNLSRYIRSRGIKFTHHYGETSLCCPARASLLSGQHTDKNGQFDNDGRRFDASSTLATDLHAVGYRTSFIGKYLNSYSIFPTADLDPPGWTTFDALYEPQERADQVVGGQGGGYTGFQVRKKGGAIVDYEDHGYSTDVIADLASARIRNATPGRPLFEWITPYAPHRARTDSTGAGVYDASPLDARSTKCNNVDPWKPASYGKAPAGDPSWTRGLPATAGDRPTAGFPLKPLCQTLLSVDRLIGQVGDALSDTGRLSNTVFVFTSDNGMAWGEHRLPSKNNPFSHHLPLYVAWPGGRGTTPRSEGTYTSNIDWRATVDDLAGATVPDSVDGLSIAPTFRDNAVGWTRPALAESQTSAYPATSYRAMRSTKDASIGPGWHYIEYASGEHGLYDRGTGTCHSWSSGDPQDPCELDNLYAKTAGADARAWFEARGFLAKGVRVARNGVYTEK